MPKCKCGNSATDEYINICDKCTELLKLSFKNTSVGIKADKLIEAQNNDIITNECFIKKRDRLLHLEKITDDKYLTKLKKEVEKI